MYIWTNGNHNFLRQKVGSEIFFHEIFIFIAVLLPNIWTQNLKSLVTILNVDRSVCKQTVKFRNRNDWQPPFSREIE